MTNPLAGEFVLKTPTKTYRLDLGVNTMCLIEATLDRPAMDVLQELTEGPTLTRLRFIIWAALQEEHAADAPDEKAAGKIMGQVQLSDLQSMIITALAGAMPTGEEVAAGAGDPPPAG